MAQSLSQSLLVISVDLEPGSQSSSQRGLQVTRLGQQLVGLFDKHQIQATWSVANPGRHALSAQVCESPLHHELALHADSSWIGPQAGRSRFAGELQQRLGIAREYHVDVRSLVARQGLLPPHGDLLVKHQIGALRGVAQPLAGGVQWSQPQAVRYGLWNLPASCVVPANRSWWGDITTMQVHRALRLSASSPRVLHVTVDAERIVDGRNVYLRSLEKLLVHMVRFRVQGAVRVAAMREAVQLITERPTIAPARSILRAAA